MNYLKLLKNLIGVYMILSIVIPWVFSSPLFPTIFPLYYMTFWISSYIPILILGSVPPTVLNLIAYFIQFLIILIGVLVIWWRPRWID